MIALDSNVFIYALNAHPEFGQKAREVLLSRYEKVACELIFGEIFSSPKLENESLGNKVMSFLEDQRIDYVPITREVNLKAGQLRRKYKSLKMADALHLAAAILCGADIFITNDSSLAKLSLPGLKVNIL